MELSQTAQCFTVHIEIDGCGCNCFLARNVFCAETRSSAFSEEHSHTCCELLFCKSGTGVEFINDVGHSYTANSVFLMAPFVTHAHISDETCSEARYSILFELEPAPAGSALNAVRRHLQANGFFHYAAGATEQTLMQQIVQLLCSEPPYAKLLLGGLLSALFSYVFQQICATSHADSRIPAAITDSDRIFLINYFFDHMMDTNVRMEDLCEQVHLSPSQLNRVIREQFGTTFKQKMIDIRICYAKYFLRFSPLTVSEIAQRTGFSEDSNFSLFFKQHCGITPSQYRRQFQTAEAASSD